MCSLSEVEKRRNNLNEVVFYGCFSAALSLGGFAICMPFFQSRRDELNCDVLCQGSMTSLRSFLNLIGSVIIGRLSDNLSDRKKCIYLGALASIADFIILGSTFSISGLWWGSVFGSLLQHNFSIMKAIIADCYEEIDRCLENEGATTRTSSAERASSIGKLGMSAGLAFMVGPAVGGYAVKNFNHAIMLGSVCVITSLIFTSRIPRCNPPKKREKEEKEVTSSSQELLNFFNLKAARSPPAIFFMTIRTAMGLAYHIFNTVWNVCLKNRFEFGPSDYGRFFSFIGLVFALSQGFVAGRLVRWFGPKRRIPLILICCLSLGFGRWFVFQTQDLRVVYLLFSFIITALGTMNTIIAVDTSKMASSDEIGGLMGLLDAVQSASGMLGPIIGGVLGQISWGRDNEDFTTNVNATLAAVVGLYVFIFFLVYFGYEKFVVKEEMKREKTTDTAIIDAKETEFPDRKKV